MQSRQQVAPPKKMKARPPKPVDTTIYDCSEVKSKGFDKDGKPIFVYEKSQDTVVLIVRPGNTFGGMKAPEGSLVRVDVKELDNPATMSALMTDEQAEDLKAKIEKKERERNKPKRNMVKEMVEAGLAKLAAVQR